MRTIVIALALCASWYYLATSHSQVGDMLVQTVGNTAVDLWSALPRPGKKLEQALREERQRSENLEAELVQLRQALTRSDAETVTRGTALAHAQMALKARETAETTAVARAEALGARLATAQQEFMHQSETLQKQMAENEARAAALRRDNGLLQDRLNGAAAKSTADDTTRVSLQSDLQAAIQNSQQQQERSRRLASDLEHLRETSASQIAALQGQLDGVKAQRAAKVEAPSTVLPNADGIGVSTQAAGNSTEPINPEPLVTPVRDTLAEEIRTHVIVRFTADDPSAKARALRLGSTLQAQGMLIEQIVGLPSRLHADSLSYFYKSDEIRAGLITTLFPEFRSSMRQRPPEDGIPRPGLIEIEVAT